MKIPAAEVAAVVGQIQKVWQVGPTHLADVVCVSRQSIHEWTKKGAPQNKYRILKEFLRDGPEPEVTFPPKGRGFSFCLNVSVDLTNPEVEVQEKIKRAIPVLQALVEILAKNSETAPEP